MQAAFSRRGPGFFSLPLFKQLRGFETAQTFDGTFPCPFVAEPRELGVFVAFESGLFTGLLHALH